MATTQINMEVSSTTSNEEAIIVDNVSEHIVDSADTGVKTDQAHTRVDSGVDIEPPKLNDQPNEGDLSSGLMTPEGVPSEFNHLEKDGDGAPSLKEPEWTTKINDHTNQGDSAQVLKDFESERSPRQSNEHSDNGDSPQSPKVPRSEQFIRQSNDQENEGDSAHSLKETVPRESNERQNTGNSAPQSPKQPASELSPRQSIDQENVGDSHPLPTCFRDLAIQPQIADQDLKDATTPKQTRISRFLRFFKKSPHLDTSESVPIPPATADPETETETETEISTGRDSIYIPRPDPSSLYSLATRSLPTTASHTFVKPWGLQTRAPRTKYHQSLNLPTICEDSALLTTCAEPFSDERCVTPFRTQDCLYRRRRGAETGRSRTRYGDQRVACIRSLV